MFKILVLVLLGAVALGGCATNPYAQFYQPGPPQVVQQISERRMQPPPEAPALIHGSNPEQDIPALMAEGYTIVGQSSFNGPAADEDKALDQGKAVGADEVVLFNRYSSTEHVNVPLTLPTTQTSVTNGTATAFGTGGMATAYGTATTTTYGTETTYIPRTIRRYDSLAVYLVKVKYALGARYRPLTTEEAQRVGSVNGVTLAIVIRGSPAAAAGLLPGDIVLKVDSEPVVDPAQFGSVLEQRTGHTVTLTTMRGANVSQRSVTLGSY